MTTKKNTHKISVVKMNDKTLPNDKMTVDKMTVI